MTAQREEGTQSTEPGDFPSRPEGALALLVLDPEGHREFALPAAGIVTIGRSSKADICVADASVSRQHAVLEVHDAALEIRDVGATNGIRLRGRKLARGEVAPLGVGEVLELGKVSISVLARGPTSEVDAAVTAGRVEGAVVLHPAMIKLYDLVSRVAGSEISVLILGETGVGKELLAEAIHRGSSRASSPLVRVNCAALTPSLVESELFGHEKGAFTGATAARPGFIEAAHGGTLFLDEVGELPLALQAKLLRVLEDRQVLRVGAQRARSVDLRFVAATHRNLRDEVAHGTFRRDLYYRLNGITLTVPPLRERVVEIGPMAARFLSTAASAPRCAALSPTVVAALEAHDWPGNVRELRNAIARALLVAGDRPITVDDLPEEQVCARPGDAPPEGGDLRDEIEALERRRIEDALSRTGGNQTHAALLLGMPRRTLVTRLKEYGIERPRDRRDS